MLRALKYLIISLGVILTLTISFFFWSTQHNWEESRYVQININSNAELLDTKQDSFLILTYNLGYLSGLTNNKEFPGEELIKENQQLVKTNIDLVHPDIVALQEVDFDADRSYHIDQAKGIAGNTFKYIANVVNWDVRYVPFPYWPPADHFGQVVSGQSVLSKFKLSDLERIQLSRISTEPFWRDAYYLDRLAQVVKVELSGKELILINVHLEAWDKPTRQQQLEEVIELWNKYASDLPVILLGDFNSDPGYKEATISKLLNLPGVNTVNLPASDYEKTYPSDAPTERLDYIFYNDKLKCNKAVVVSTFGQMSDHLPLLMNFSFKD